MSKRLKLIVVGDGAMGKTSLLIRYATDRPFPIEYIPTVFDNYVAERVVPAYAESKTTVNLGLWDTGGGEDYSRLRPLSYPDTDVFLLCCAVDDDIEGDNILDEWAPELKDHMPRTPVILVGTKSDLRENTDNLEDEGMSNFEARVKLAKRIKAVAYLECSAFTEEGVQAVFDMALNVGYENSLKKKKKRCKCALL